MNQNENFVFGLEPFEQKSIEMVFITIVIDNFCLREISSVYTNMAKN